MGFGTNLPNMHNPDVLELISHDIAAIDAPLGDEGRRRSCAILERRATEEEVLQYVLEVESSREYLEKYATHLNKVVDDSAKAIREAQLAAQQKSDFLATMSHELRTPLNGIIGMTTVLLAKELRSCERDYVETIRSSGEALLTIVDDVLHLSKIEAGRLELESVDYNLIDLIKGAVQIVAPLAAAKYIELSIEIDRKVPGRIKGDSGRLRQILLNLLSNAIKFTPAGKVELKVQLTSDTASSLELRFDIADEGIGMTPEQQARLFKPYSQADTSTSKRFGGTGLGLVISKRLCEMMGGAIGLHSEPGHGTTFWFTIRAHRAPTLSSDSGALTHPKLAQSSTACGDRLVLLVEDNLINQKVALLMLKKLGYQAEVANHGAEAVRMMAAKHYDLVLMDCQMPEMDGFEATRLIRAMQSPASAVPIIAMTANAFVEDRQACLEAGMTDYLSKPVREAELSTKLESWLLGA